MPTDDTMDRREFLRAVGRYLLLGALALGGATLVRRANPERCVNDGICGRCAELPDCHLPRALSLKQARGEQPYDR